MLIVRIETNLLPHKIPCDASPRATCLMAGSFNLPQTSCAASIVSNPSLNWGGTNDPCAVAYVYSLDQIGINENKKHTALLSKFIYQQLGVSYNRIGIIFTNPNISDVGYNGTTFHDLRGLAS